MPDSRRAWFPKASASWVFFKGQGANQGFLVVWNEDGLVRGRPYGGRASPLKAPVDVDTAKSAETKTA